MSAITAISAVAGLVGKAMQPITHLIDDERFTPQEKAELKNSQLLAEMANERAAIEMEKLQWQVHITEQERMLAEAKADADAQMALARIQEAQTKEDDLYTKRLRPTVGYLMTLMLLADQVGAMCGHGRFFNWILLSGYFATMGIYIGGRSIEKIKRKS